MKKILKTLIIFLVFTGIASANQFTLLWQAPALTSDGRTVTPDMIDHYNVFQAICNGTWSGSINDSVCSGEITYNKLGESVTEAFSIPTTVITGAGTYAFAVSAVPFPSGDPTVILGESDKSLVARIDIAEQDYLVPPNGIQLNFSCEAGTDCYVIKIN